MLLKINMEDFQTIHYQADFCFVRQTVMNSHKYSKLKLENISSHGTSPCMLLLLRLKYDNFEKLENTGGMKLCMFSPSSCIRTTWSLASSHVIPIQPPSCSQAGNPWPQIDDSWKWSRRNNSTFVSSGTREYETEAVYSNKIKILYMNIKECDTMSLVLWTTCLVLWANHKQIQILNKIQEKVKPENSFSFVWERIFADRSCYGGVHATCNWGKGS